MFPGKRENRSMNILIILQFRIGADQGQARLHMGFVLFPRVEMLRIRVHLGFIPPAGSSLCFGSLVP